MLVQRKLIIDGDVKKDSKDFETWSTTHVLRECTNPTRKVKMLIVRFEDDEEEEIYQRIVHMPCRTKRIHTKG